MRIANALSRLILAVAKKTALASVSAVKAEVRSKALSKVDAILAELVEKGAALTITIGGWKIRVGKELEDDLRKLASDLRADFAELLDAAFSELEREIERL